MKNIEYKIPKQDLREFELSLKSIIDLSYEAKPEDMVVSNLVKKINKTLFKFEFNQDNAVLNVKPKELQDLFTNVHKIIDLSKKNCELDDWALEDINNLEIEVNNYLKPMVEYTNTKPVGEDEMFEESDVVVNGKNFSRDEEDSEPSKLH